MARERKEGHSEKPWKHILGEKRSVTFKVTDQEYKQIEEIRDVLNEGIAFDPCVSVDDPSHSKWMSISSVAADLFRQGLEEDYQELIADFNGR